MPLSILLILVVGGIAGIALMLHLLGYSTPRRFAGAEDAARAWARYAPDDPVREVWISSDGRAALVQSDAGLGLLWAMGADSAAHPLRGADLQDRSDGLWIALHDFAAPGQHVRLSAAERARWRQRIEADQ